MLMNFLLLFSGTHLDLARSCGTQLIQIPRYEESRPIPLQRDCPSFSNRLLLDYFQLISIFLSRK